MKVEGYPIKWCDIWVFHRAPNPGFSEEPLNDGGEYELWHWELKAGSYLCAFGKVLMVDQGEPRDLDCNLEK
jgi:hypothetical protein